VTLSDDRRILVITPRDVLNPFTSYGADLSILTDIFGALSSKERISTRRAIATTTLPN